MNKKPIIYLDNNATTPIDKRVLESMMPFLTDNFANANSTHQFGVEAYNAVKAARLQVSKLIGANPNEIIFTSSATESINFAIKGIAESYLKKGKHIITVKTEHKAVLETCQYLENKGYDVTYLPVKHDGLIDLRELNEALRRDTILVSVMFVNNEIGVIQPIKEIVDLSHKANALFMTDATQAVGKIPLDVHDLGIDLMCFSGHKFYAPKGIGGLFLKQNISSVLKASPLLHGGGHEGGFRSGTLNVPSIVAFGKACEIAKNEMKSNIKYIRNLRDYLENELLKIPYTSINGSIENRIFNTTNICFMNIDSDAMIIGLSDTDEDSPIIAISNGSACTATDIAPSHVLIAMGLKEQHAFSSIRFSLGKFNTKNEIDYVIDNVRVTVDTLRKMVEI